MNLKWLKLKDSWNHSVVKSQRLSTFSRHWQGTITWGSDIIILVMRTLAKMWTTRVGCQKNKWPDTRNYNCIHILPLHRNSDRVSNWCPCHGTSRQCQVVSDHELCSLENTQDMLSTMHPASPYKVRYILLKGKKLFAVDPFADMSRVWYTLTKICSEKFA